MSNPIPLSSILIECWFACPSGDGAATTIIDAGGGSGLANSGTLRITAAGAVKVDGLTVQNPKSSTGGVRAGMEPIAPASGAYRLTRNVIVGGNNPADTEDYGLYAHGGEGSVVFQSNVVRQVSANPILIERHAGATDVSWNLWDRGVGSASMDGYFNMNYGGAAVTTLQKVSRNVVNMGNDSGLFDNAHRGFAITFACLAH